MYANICKVCTRVIEKGSRHSFPKFKSGLRLYNSTAFPSFGLKNGLRSTCLKTPYLYSTNVEHLNPIKDGLQEEERATKTVDESDALTVGPPEELMLSLSEEDQRKLKVLWMELEVFRQSGSAVPRKLTLLQWKETLEKDSRSQRLKFYRYLCLNESRQEHEREKKEANRKTLERVRAERELERAANPDAVDLQYGLTRNTIFLRLRDATMNMAYSYWQCHGIMYGQTIVIDLGYDKHMVHRESVNCADQIRDVYGFNKMNRQPFNLHLCNADPTSNIMQQLIKFIPNMNTPACLMTVTEKSYLDLFPKSKLVYLTPHCKTELAEFDHDTIYIIGGIVDKSIQQPVSLAKAKREGIRVARLPLDQYLNWGEGTKSLTLDQMMKIMLDIKNTGCWNTAFNHVPKRKLKDNTMSSSPNLRTRFRFKKNLFDDE